MLKGESRQPPRRGRPRKAAGETLANGVAGRSQRDAGVSFLERGPDEKLFRFHIGGRLRKLLAQAMKRAGLKFPRRQGGFHLFCHTYGTWMTRYGGLDTCGLVRCFDGGPCSYIRQCVAAQFNRATWKRRSRHSLVLKKS